jgi:hypothetical protein
VCRGYEALLNNEFVEGRNDVVDFFADCAKTLFEI